MSKTGRLSWNQLLFAVEGRATRFDYWMRWVLPYCIGAFIAAFLDDALGTVNPAGGVGVIMVIYIIAAIWPNLAVGIKRCHDRGRSGWFLLIGLVPLLNLWLAVELMFLRGTVGLNRFGPDPLDGLGAAAAGLTT
ncbi:MAG: DUF805 domain-containing protein [Stellaceae bacterium]